MKPVVVVGSGLAGLSAGYRLRERGWQVTVFEALGRVGGRVLSESDPTSGVGRHISGSRGANALLGALEDRSNGEFL